jgi:acetyltransferase-like isoleucine patch superfamily enzyme
MVLKRIAAMYAKLRLWIFLRPRVTGRIKIRGNVANIKLHASFRCDGDLWIGVYSSEGELVIDSDVSASGPLVVTAIGSLRIKSGVLLGPNIVITDHYHGDLHNADHQAQSPSDRPLYTRGPIFIDQDVLVGANSVILSPSNIGRRAVIGANSVVKNNIVPNTVFIGK